MHFTKKGCVTKLHFINKNKDLGPSCMVGNLQNMQNTMSHDHKRFATLSRDMYTTNGLDTVLMLQSPVPRPFTATIPVTMLV